MTSKASDKPVSHIPPYGLRMQWHLRDRIEAAAKDNGRSLHAEIIRRLELSFASVPAEGQGIPDELRESLEKLFRLFDKTKVGPNPLQRLKR